MPGHDPAAWLAGVLLAALAVDLLAGEPPAALHPVVWIGRLVALGRRVAPRRGRLFPFLAGTLLALTIPALFATAAAGALAALEGQPWLRLFVAVYLLKGSFALRGLGRAARVVRDALVAGRIDQARAGLASLCGRDASILQPPELVSATVESLAENASDSVVAPLCFYLVAGVPGALWYRAVNTLDSMLGYRGPTEYQGKAAARIDDLANLVPARLTAVLLLLCGWACGGQLRRGLRIWRRDGRRTASPNAGQPMAAMAGLLGVELAKPGAHRLGDAVVALEPARIDEAWRMVRLAALAGCGLAIGALHA